MLPVAPHWDFWGGALSFLRVLHWDLYISAFQARLIYNILMSGAIIHVHEKISSNAHLSPVQV